ncbi:TIGR02147 family protein [Bdellovibrio sp. HCB209]|uniref:TIGR02147 family protein n=1 Tax=Bdellovibrio sp. HCB209 TaxID=3394354 RepID=UPI0039B658A5
MIQNAPVIFDFLDIQFYLQAYYQFRKSQDKQFSYDSWSQELGINSRSFLRLMVIGKKKVSARFIDSFCLLTLKDPSQEEYFRYLVKYSQAASQKDKQAFGASLVQILKVNTQQKTIPEFESFVSTPLKPRLLTLLSFSDIDHSSQTLAQLFNIKESEIQKALHEMQEAGLIESDSVDGQKRWKSANKKFKVQDKKGSEDLAKFHKQSLLDAIAAISLPLEVRTYKSLILPMSPEELALFTQAMNTFSSEQFAKFSSDEYAGRRLFQINLNVHPVTEPLREGTSATLPEPG